MGKSDDESVTSSKSVKSRNKSNGSKRNKNDDAKSVKSEEKSNGSKANKNSDKIVKEAKNTATSRMRSVKVMAHRNIPVQYPMLTDTNYGVWAVKMKIILRSLRVWQAITDDEVDDECDEGAMAAIAQSVPNSVLMTLAEFETAREVWDALKEMRIGEDRVTKARAQVLKRQFHKLQMEET